MNKHGLAFSVILGGLGGVLSLALGTGVVVVHLPLIAAHSWISNGFIQIYVYVLLLLSLPILLIGALVGWTAASGVCGVLAFYGGFIAGCQGYSASRPYLTLWVASIFPAVLANPNIRGDGSNFKWIGALALLALLYDGLWRYSERKRRAFESELKEAA